MPQDGYSDQFLTDSFSLCTGQKNKNQRTRRPTWLTIVGLCSFIRSIMLMAAFFLAALEDLEATVKGYINAWG